MHNLEFLKESLRHLSDPETEAFVRNVLSQAALKCPIDVLQKIGELLISLNRDELDRETLSN